MNILNTVEREASNSPPVFNSFQRKQYFYFPSKLRRFVAGLRSPAYRVGFLLSAGYFCWNLTIERAGPSTRKNFFEFFTVPIRNAHTRAAYYRAIQQFLAWVERAGYQQLEDIEPITVAAL